MTTENKIQGVLAMAAIGDSMGAATENLTFDQIRAMYHGPVSTFLKPGKQNFALGNEAGECTDDFSQIWFLSNAIVDNQGTIDKETVIRAMLAWSDVPKYFDRFAGPTTRTAIAMYRDPNRRMQPLPGAVTVDYASKATNGAAMKIAPAAMLHSDDIEGAVADAVTITQVTHDNSLAISGACATAAASSAGLAEHATYRDIIAAGVYGAIRGENIAARVSRVVSGPSVIRRIKLALEIADSGRAKDEKLRALSEVVGSGLHISEAVPCAFGIIALNKGDALQSVIDAVNIGYDTDTVATITGTMVGGLVDWNDPKVNALYQQVQKANDMNLTELATKLATATQRS